MRGRGAARLRDDVGGKPLRGLTSRSGFDFWSNRTVFVLAMAGTAVGFSNIWRFPYLVGEHGGSAFVLLYVACVAVVGFPLLVAEIMIGRMARRDPIRAVAWVATREGRSGGWAAIAVVGMIAGGLLLSVYSIVGGWAMAYVFRAASAGFAGLDAIASARLFRGLVGDPERLLAWHTLFMAVTTAIVSRGVREGLEEAARWFMPVLLGVLLVIVFYAYGRGAFSAAMSFLFRPDFSRLDGAAVLAALGHAFFSLSVGMGAMMALGAYADERVPILGSALLVTLLDTAVALLAGMAVFPLVFEAGLSAGSGPGLVFQALPLAFGALPGGRYLGTLFFAMLVIAAWSSAIALMEPAVAWLVGRGRMDRPLAATLVGVVVWALGVLSLLSFNVYSHLRLPFDWAELGRGTFFDGVGFLVTGILLPVGGLALALFVGWRMSAHTARLALGDGPGFRVWLVLIRCVTPLAVALVLLHASGLLRLIW